MISTSLYILSLATLSMAQSPVASLLLPIAAELNFTGSIVGSDSTATTYVIPCPSAAASNSTQTSGSSNSSSDNSEALSCGFTSVITVTQGPSTLHYSYSVNSFVQTVDCNFTGTTKAVCAGQGSEQFDTASTVSPVTSTFIGSDIPAFTAVTITAGLGNAKVTGQASNSALTASSGNGGPTATKGSTTTGSSSAAVAKSTGGSGGMMVEPTLGLGAAGALAVGVVAILL